MVAELKALPHPDGGAGSLLDAIDLVVPHQANKSMVAALAQAAGLDPALLYFDIAHVGNTSAASIPIAIHDAIREGRLARRMRVFTPGFGAGAVAGYVVLQVDPAVAA
jgi:3-oxoacyl-[acyl-carrier-protein] synthase III